MVQEEERKYLIGWGGWYGGGGKNFLVAGRESGYGWRLLAWESYDFRPDTTLGRSDI